MTLLSNPYFSQMEMGITVFDLSTLPFFKRFYFEITVGTQEITNQYVEPPESFSQLPLVMTPYIYVVDIQSWKHHPLLREPNEMMERNI